jgi:hypothetical protein
MRGYEVSAWLEKKNTKKKDEGEKNREKERKAVPVNIFIVR